MFAIKVIIGAVLLVAVSARSIEWDSQGYDEGFPYRRVYPYMVDGSHFDYGEFDHPFITSRVRRQAQGTVTLNSDGGMGLSGKVPLAGNDKNILSAIGSASLDDRMKSTSRGFGLALDNVNGHGLSVMKESVPGFGDRLTGAGKLNVFHNANHDVNANAFVTRNMPNIPQVPNFNTVGGGLDYMYKNKIGGSVGMASTPFLQRKDYSAAANLNLFRNPSTSVDFSGGFRKFETPVMNSGWKPNFGLSFSKYF